MAIGQGFSPRAGGWRGWMHVRLFAFAKDVGGARVHEPASTRSLVAVRALSDETTFGGTQQVLPVYSRVGGFRAASGWYKADGSCVCA